MIDISINSSALDATLAAISRRIAHKRDLLDDVGAALAENVRLGFTRSADPYGRAWAPLTARKGEPLRDTGRLMNSITHRTSANDVVVGTNVKYAAIHQFGGDIEHAARSIRVRLRKTRDGRTQFAKDSHKRVTVKWGEAQPWTVRIPARPFLPTAANGLPPDWETQVMEMASRFLMDKKP